MKFAICRTFYQISAILAMTLVLLPARASDQKPSDDAVAVVNGVVITRAQYDQELDVHIKRISRQGTRIPDDQMGALKKDILEGLIEREVLYQETQKAGINISDQIVDGELASIKKRFASEQEFEKALSGMGLTEEDVRIQIQRGLAIRDLIEQRVAEKVVITDAETKAYYTGNPQLFNQPEQVKASHILIKVEPTADEAQKTAAGKKIEEVRQKLTAGGDFTELAKQYSEGPSGVRGGDLGYFQRGQMVKPFEDAAFSMQINEVSGRIETRFGYHLIKVYDKKPARTLAYADVKDRIAQRLKQQQVEKDATRYVQDLKQRAKIEKML